MYNNTVFNHSRENVKDIQQPRCTEPTIDKFPSDIFTHEERIHGAVNCHVFIAVYLFLALSIICDKYFVPAVQKISKALNMSAGVAGATILAAATSAPELFVNIIGTFITKGDIGVNTIVGSAVFNILASTACCGLFSPKPVSMEPWSLARDSTVYLITVVTLYVFASNQNILWYEALIFVSMYIGYIIVMCFDKKLQEIWPFKFNKTIIINSPKVESENISSSIDVRKENEIELGSVPPNADSVTEQTENVANEGENDEPNILDFPTKKTWWRIIIWLLILPINIAFVLTIPDCNRKRFKNWYPLTFFSCVFWIASLSYVICWMITIIGDTLEVPDSVMGISFLAFGATTPEAATAIIVAKLGRADMGVSSSLGSNIFNILFCLGFPWLLKSIFMPLPNGHAIHINSEGIQYTTIALLVVSLLFFCIFAANKFKLDKKIACICLVLYAIFLILATLTELNVFGHVNFPTCPH